MSIEKIIGNTPIIELTKLNANANVRIYAKLEGQNPGGSVKDRAAYNMINEAMLRGDLKKGDTIVEATSGNTGIALAMVSAILDIKCTLIMPENSSIERVKTMKAYGANVILTPQEKTIEYSRELAIKMHQEEGYYLLNQFDNPDNYKAHIKTTGPEIWNQTNGEITHFVSAMGTTGTITGVSEYLKTKNKAIQVIGAEPKEGDNIPGIRKWSSEFRPTIFKPKNVDIKKEVSRIDAEIMMNKLSTEEGIFGGISSGGAAKIALDLAANLTEGTIVFIVCDRGDRYLSKLQF